MGIWLEGKPVAERIRERVKAEVARPGNPWAPSPGWSGFSWAKIPPPRAT